MLQDKGAIIAIFLLFRQADIAALGRFATGRRKYYRITGETCVVLCV
ncbi:hypothetical protein ACFPVS_09610 [Neisseria weixii]|nr:hypothetical protein [Neisseria weixii]